MDSVDPNHAERRRAPGSAKRIASLVIAVLLNVAFMTVAEWGLRPLPKVDASPPVELELLPPPLPQPRIPHPSSPARSKAHAPDVASSSPVIPPTTPAAPSSGPPPAPAATPSDADGMRAVLRATLGCSHSDLVELTPGERERCRERQEAVKAPPGVGPLARIDPSRLADLDADVGPHEPILHQTPHNNCVVRVGEGAASGAASTTQAMRGGFACAKSF